MKNLHHFESNLSGIYLITCLPNQKKYIGSSKNIYYRLRRHLSDLRKNRHSNPILQNCFNKYGEDCLTTQILEQGGGDLIQKEKQWIDSLKPEMNINDPAYIIFNEDTKKKISDSLIEYFKKHPQTGRTVTVFTLDGKLFKVYDSISQADKELSPLTSKGISKAFYGHRPYKNYMIKAGKYTEDIEPYIPPERVYKHLDKLLESIKRGRNTVLKNRLEKSMGIKNLTFSIPEEFKILSRDTFKGCAKPVVQFDLCGNFVAIHKSIVEAAKSLNVKQDAIEACVKGDTMSSNKFIWKPLFQFIN